jgi:pimeloyl-ACP methyl ester carboxylesterase
MKKHFFEKMLISGLPALFLIGVLVMFSGCAYFANRPLNVLSYIDSYAASHKNLFVFVRGLGGSHHSFADEGIVDATLQKGISFDLVAPNSHFAYYAERTLIERLRQDVILPAKSKGYENIWLVGFSMGGLGSLLYLREHPGDINGICLISPFLGYDAIISEIINKGGLQSWTPGDYSPEKDWERMLWHWIKSEVANGKTQPVYLGFGREDTYAAAQELLATALPENHITRREGAHNYETFKALWRSFLDREVYLAP